MSMIEVELTSVTVLFSVTDQNASAGPSKLLKKQVNYPSIADALQSSPFKGLTRNMTKEKMPGYVIAVQGGYGVCSRWRAFAIN